jgi:hypothetical protein
VYPHILETGNIKQVLKACAELMSKPSTPDEHGTELAPIEPLAAVLPTPIPTVAALHSIDTMDLNLHEQPRTPEEHFAHEFYELAGHADGATISKYQASNLVRKHFGDEYATKDLVEKGFLVPKVAEGRTKTGQYAAGEKLMEIMSAPPPKNPIDRAHWLIEQEQELRAEESEIRSRLTEIETALTRIEKAKELIRQLEELTR